MEDEFEPTKTPDPEGLGDVCVVLRETLSLEGSLTMVAATLRGLNQLNDERGVIVRVDSRAIQLSRGVSQHRLYLAALIATWVPTAIEVIRRQILRTPSVAVVGSTRVAWLKPVYDNATSQPALLPSRSEHRAVRFDFTTLDGFALWTNTTETRQQLASKLQLHADRITLERWVQSDEPRRYQRL